MPKAKSTLVLFGKIDFIQDRIGIESDKVTMGVSLTEMPEGTNRSLLEENIKNKRNIKFTFEIQ